MTVIHLSSFDGVALECCATPPESGDSSRDKTDLALDLVDEDILSAALQTLDETFAEQPKIDARLCGTIGKMNIRLGRYERAEPELEKSLEASKRVLGAGHQDTADALYNLACLEAVRGDGTKALEWLRQSVEAGYANADGMLEDTGLGSLHGPEFDALVERARRNGA